MFLKNEANSKRYIIRDGGTGGGAGRAAAPVALYQEGQGVKVPFQFKGLHWRNSELSEMLVQFF